MLYLEELSGGDCFELDSQYYILSQDFKSNGQRMCLNLSSGFPSWVNGNSMVNNIDIFTLDKDNNIIAFKQREKPSVTAQNKNIS